MNEAIKKANEIDTVYEHLEISKTFTSQEEFLKSEELKKLFEGFVNDMPRRVKRTKFIAVYVIEKDPAKNYGQPCDLLWHFEIADDKYKGMKRLMKVTLGSTLHNSGFQIAEIHSEFNTILITRKAYEQSDVNRMRCIQNGWIIY